MTELGEIIADTTSRLLQHEDLAAARAACEDGRFPARLWTAIEEAGLPLLLAAEAQGGAGLGLEEAVRVAELFGEHAAPVPLVESVLGNWLLGAARLPLGDGPLTVAIDTGTALPALEAGTLRGSVRAVPFGRLARRIAVVARSGEGLAIAIVPGAVSAAETRNLAGEPREDIEFTLVPQLWGPLPPTFAAEMILARAALLRAGQMVGAMKRAFVLTQRYSSERSQFGRRLVQFQAIQHQLAVMATHIAACEVAVMTAARRAEERTATFDAAVAKARVSEAAALVAAIAHQVHGAMGFTHEYELHHATKRLWSWRDDWGDERFWQGRLGDYALAAPDLWSLVTAHQDA